MMTKTTNLGRHAALSLAALPIMALAAPANAATADGIAETLIIEQLSLTQTDGLDFGTIIPSGTAGNIRIRRNNGICEANGGATLIGTDCQRGVFQITGPALQTVRVTHDSGPITLSRSSGSGSMTMDRVWINGRANKRLNGSGALTFYVAGRLRVGANQAPGVYDGTFNVTVDYR